MGMSESPPPTVIQLRDILDSISQQVLDDGTYSNEVVYQLGLCRGLVEWLITHHPSLVGDYGG